MDLSVLIPVFNEEMFIENCLESIFKYLDQSKIRFEVIVIDNGSNDRTSSILKANKNIKLYRIPRSTVAYARNFGAARAEGDILAFIDGDVLVTKEWGATMERFVQDKSKSNTLTGFQCITRADGSWVERYWFSNMDSSHINSGNLIISKSAFEYLNGFNENLRTGEDFDLCERAKFADGINFEKNRAFAAIHVDYPRTLKRFFLREVWHGEGDCKSLKFFLKSKVALVSVVYGISSIMSLLLVMFGYFESAIVLILLLVVFNFLISIYRFKCDSLKAILVCGFLNYIYFIARFFSVFSSFYKRNKSY
jgi:glycosyltransferase involved in cell wall biosynthesis